MRAKTVFLYPPVLIIAGRPIPETKAPGSKVQ